MKKTVVNISRIILALVFILSGFVKAVDPLGSQYKIGDYLVAMQLGGMLPDWVMLVLAVLQSGIEFCLGLFLLFAIRRRLTSRLILLIMVVMTPLTLWLAIANPIHDCGCFGDAVVLTNWQTFWKNVILLVMAAVVARWPKEMFRFVSKTNQWLVTNYSALFILVVSVYCLNDLPLFDFRPYHVGVNLRQGWQEMMEGKDSPYTDLFLENIDDGEDLTEQLLNDSSYVFLLVSPYLEQADDSRFDLINELNEYAKEHGYEFYGLTASGMKSIGRWRNMTGAEYSFCQADDILLKTVVRSNPGLVLMKNGTIIRKWSHNNLPVIEENSLSMPLEKLEIGQMPEDSVPRKIFLLLMWFVLPLALLTIADRTWMWSKWLRREKQKNES